MGYIELAVLDDRPKKIVIGIDLGTTNSLAALWIGERPEVLAAPGSSGLVPSVVYFPERGEPLVGEDAKAHALTDPRHTIFSIKRFMGRGLADVAEDLATLPYRVEETANGLLQIVIRGRRVTPQEISALILREVCARASRAFDGAEIASAVITVPAYFDDTQRQATRDAARLAGIEVLRIVNEPTAASLAYGLDRREAGTVVVYDLGGGTFDVSVLSIEDGVFQVLATNGDTHLGGDDFDRTLVDLAREELAGLAAPEDLADPTFLQAARLTAERCKVALSGRPEHDLVLSVPGRDRPWRRTVSVAELEARVAPLVERTLACCRNALRDAHLEPSQIDEVVLVGGSTRVPLVRRRVEELFGRKPHTELDPDQVVALGAAAQAQVLMGGTREILLMDVTPLSLGLETMGGAVAKLIERNSTVPCSHTEGFTTYVDGQTGIDFHIVQGEREMASDCRTLGRFKLTGIPPLPAGMARVGVKFHIDADGLLTVTAKEESTGAKASIEVKPMHGLTDGEVEGMLAEGLEHAREDFDARRVADLTIEIGTMLRAIEKNLDGARASLDRESLEDLEGAVEAARAVSGATPLAAVQTVRDELERASKPLAAALMDRVVREAVAGRKLSDV